MSRPTDVTSKLKASDPNIRNYVFELEKENLKLHKQVVKLQVKVVSQQNHITALKQAQPKTILRVVNFANVDNKSIK